MPDSDALDPLDQIVERFLQEKRTGNSPTIEAYVARFPEYAQELREVLEACAIIDEAEPHESEWQSTSSFESGRRIGEYRLLREIGRGGMGVVYEAEQESLGRRVALKVMQPDYAHSAEALQRFRREARAAARMHHTNIVPIFDVGEDDSGCYYAMQYIRGRGLDQVRHQLVQIRSRERSGSRTTSGRYATSEEVDRADSTAQRAPLDHDDSPAVTDRADFASREIRREQESESSVSSSAAAVITTTHQRSTFMTAIADIGLQSAEAIAHAHARGIIHRDIKPSNLLLDQQGRVWVTDFGLAKTDDEDLTKTDAIIGTLRYMSPERFLGKCDERADIYALGITLYELVTLQDAFDGVDRVQLISRIQYDDPISPRRIDPSIPRDLETIILKAIQKDPNQRYASAQLLAQDLRLFLEHRPILARRASPPERVVRWVRRNQLLATTTSLIFLLLLCVAGGALWMASQDRQRRDEAIASRNAIAEQRARAEFNLEQAVSAVETLLTRLADERLAKAPHTAEIRREMLEDAVRFHQSILQQNKGEPRLRFLTVNAQYRLAEIYRLLGDTERSESSFEATLIALAEVTEREPDRVQDWNRLTNNCRRGYAGLLIELKRFDEGRPLIETGISQLSLIQSESDRDEERALHLSKLGEIAMGQGDYPEAAKYLKHSRELLEEYWPFDEASSLRTAFLTVLINEAEALLTIGNFHDGKASLEKCRSYAKELAEVDANDPKARQILGMSTKSLGQQYGREGDFQRSLELLGDAIEVLGALARDYPSIPVYAFNHAGACNDLAVAYARQRKLEDARPYFEQGANILAELVHDFPELYSYARSLGYSYNNLATLAADLGAHTQQLGYLEKAVDVRQRLVERFPDSPDYLGELSVSLIGLAGYFAEENDHSSAAPLFLRGIEIGEDLAERFPENQSYRHKLAIAYRSYGGLLSTSNPSECERAFAQSEKLFDQLMRETSDSIRPAHERAKAIRALAEHRELSQGPRFAIPELARTISSLDLIRHEFGTELTEINLDLAEALTHLALLEAMVHQFDDSHTTFSRAHKILNDLPDDGWERDECQADWVESLAVAVAIEVFQEAAPIVFSQ